MPAKSRDRKQKTKRNTSRPPSTDASDEKVSNSPSAPKDIRSESSGSSQPQIGSETKKSIEKHPRVLQRPHPDKWLKEKATNHKILPQVIFFAIFTLLLVSADHWLRTERMVFDWLTLINQAPAENQQVVIVKIGERDFNLLFNKRSPLEPAQVSRIVNKIASASPRVLGIDILTSDEFHREYTPEPSSFPIVWAAETVKESGKIIDIKPPLHGKALPFNHYYALPESVLDPDGVNRVYRRMITFDGFHHPTFGWLVYYLANPEAAAVKRDSNADYYIRFANTDRFEISASEVLEWGPEALRSQFADRIVLLGGMYGDARDTQRMPFGTLFGVQLNALIVETEMFGSEQKPISGFWRMALNFIAFPLAAIIFFRYGALKGFLLAGLISILTISSVTFFSYGVSSLILLVPVFFWTLVLASLDLVMDKYKKTGNELYELGKAKILKKT